MNEQRFVAIDSLQEQPDGICLRLLGGEVRLLRRSHPRFDRLVEVLRLALSLSDARPWPVYACLAPDGTLVGARPAMRGTVLGASRDSDGGFSVGLFAVSTLKKLPQDHPEFERLKEVLLGASATNRDIFYALGAADLGVLADVAFAC